MMTMISTGATAAAQIKTPAILERFKTIDGYWYVGTVCTRHPRGLVKAHADAIRVRDILVAGGIRCYVPVAYTSEMVTDAGLDIYDHDFWMAVNMPFMQRAYGMMVIASDGWEYSRGIQDEMAFFASINRTALLVFPSEIDL